MARHLLHIRRVASQRTAIPRAVGGATSSGREANFTVLEGWAKIANKLYFAFRELGRVVRTIFLLRYIGDAELRQTIRAATTKSERFNRFVKWVAFGGNSMIAENVRDEQRKFTKYNHLVANLLIFHNVVTMTKAIEQLEAESYTVSDEIRAALSPYQTDHINRFGAWILNFDRVSAPLPMDLGMPQIQETAEAPLKKSART